MTQKLDYTFVVDVPEEPTLAHKVAYIMGMHDYAYRGFLEDCLDGAREIIDIVREHDAKAVNNDTG